MADIRGIETSGETYGLKDETARTDTDTLARSIGDLSDLETTAKNNLVAAINEINGTLEVTSLTFTGGMTILKRKGNLLFIDSRLNSGVAESYPAVVGENVPEKFRPTQNLRLTVFNNNIDQPIGQFVYNENENKFRMYVAPSFVPQDGVVLVATGVTPLW